MTESGKMQVAVPFLHSLVMYGIPNDLLDLLGIYGMKLTYPLKMDGWKTSFFPFGSLPIF